VLGWVCWRTGSVLPGVLLHALHNSCIVLLGYYQPEWAAEEGHLPAAWLAAGALGGVLALVWMWLTTRRTHPGDGDKPGGTP
jgi:ABC-2 type transport system permease protein/sodium transport system permease protein